MKGREFKIASIVEGHGEVKAVPILMDLWFKHRNLKAFRPARTDAIRASGSGALKVPHRSQDSLGVEHYVELALHDGPDGILIVMDADDECVKRSGPRTEGLGPELLRRARNAAPADFPISVVIANREYEVWFLAQLRRLRTRGVLPAGVDLTLPDEIESIASPKAAFERRFGVYQESIHQQDVTRHLGFQPSILNRCPSYGKLVRELERLTAAIRGRS